jgi:hypothetical protein
MPAPKNANESYCTFTLPSDVTTGGLPSEADIAKDLESNDDNVSVSIKWNVEMIVAYTLNVVHIC